MNTTTDSPYGLERPTRHNSSFRIRSKANTPDAYAPKLRLINKQIKNNDVSQLLGGSDIIYSGTKQDVEVRDSEKREVIANLVLLRKRLDDTRDLYQKKEQEMNKYKLEIDKMKSNEDYISTDTLKTNSKAGQLRNALELQKLKLEEAMMSKKTFEGMLERMKKDMLVDKTKHKTIEKELNVRARSLNNEHQSARKAKQFKTQAENVFGGMIKQLEDEDRKRQENLINFEKAVYSKELAELAREDRIKRTENLQAIVAKEMVNDGEKRYRSLYLVHKFVHNFFKKEMDAEMAKNQTVEHAFQRIRAAVGVSDAQQFVEKFLKREETYSDLLGSIASYEKKVEEAKRQNEQLQAKLQLAKEKSTTLEKQRAGNKGNDKEIQATFKEFNNKIETYKTAKMKLERTYAWALKILVKLDKVQGITKNNYYQQLPKNATDVAFNKVVHVVRGHLKEIQKNNYSRVLDDIDHTNVESEILQKDFMRKNVRVKVDDLTERRRSISSGKSPSRGGSPNPWENSTDRHQTDQEQDEENFDDAINTHRKDIKTKMAQAALIKKAQEKLAREAAQ